LLHDVFRGIAHMHAKRNGERSEQEAYLTENTLNPHNPLFSHLSASAGAKSARKGSLQN